MRNRRATTTLEMAVICPVFFVLTLGLVQICFCFYVQQVMDQATTAAARQVQIGAAQNVGSNDQFLAKYICPNTAGLLSCSSIVVAVSAVSDYNNVPVSQFPPATINTAAGPTQTKFGFCDAAPAQLMLVQAAYLVPSILPMFFANTTTYNGSLVLPVTSTAAFMTEPFPANSTGQTAC